MTHRFLLKGLAVAALSLAGSAITAQATIIGVTPDANFSNSSVTFSLGDGTYTFSNDTNQYDQLSVKTGGSAEVTLLGGAIPNSPHSPEGVGGAGVSLPNYTNILGQSVSYKFDSFSTATAVQSFQYFGPYIGLKFLLNGEVHYGYANISDRNTLLSYAYNSVAGGGIVTGEAIDAPMAVPEPSSLAMFGLGLGLISIGVVGLRRRRYDRVGGAAQTA